MVGSILLSNFAVSAPLADRCPPYFMFCTESAEPLISTPWLARKFLSDNREEFLSDEREETFGKDYVAALAR